MDLPVERFWSMGKAGRRRSYFNSREHKWEDEVVVENGVSRYLLLGNEIASFDGFVLALNTYDWNTQTTYWRLQAIIDYGRSLGYKIPVLPMIRKPYGYVTKIYWYSGDVLDYFIPAKYPLRIDVHTGEVLTEVIRVIPTDEIPPSRTKQSNTVIKRRKGGFFVVKDGKQYFVLDGVIYEQNEEVGLWIENKDFEVRKLIESML